MLILLNVKNIIFILSMILLLSGCRDKFELNMERGEYYYNTGSLEQAILEYKKVINHYPTEVDQLKPKTIEMLANAHHNLAVILFKRGFQSEDSIEKALYLEQANSEAKLAYNLFPKDIYKKTWDNIKKIMK